MHLRVARSRDMYRNDLDFLRLETPPQATRRDSARSSPSDNSPARVLWEIGLVLAGALSFAVAVNKALTLFHVT
jgi:hypothetical protein